MKPAIFENLSEKISEKFTLERTLIYILVAAVIITFTFIGYLLFSQFTKNIRVLTPSGKEEWQIGETYNIEWKASGVDRVGIVLFKGSEPKWIAQNVLAALGRYEWKIEPGQAYGDDYWVAVFEYPWQKNSKIDYSKGAFAITYPEQVSCDDISLENKWVYVASNWPNARQVFITVNSYSGNMGGLAGADQICQQEADKAGYQGKWTAFLGGDADQEIAVTRLNQGPRKTGGVFIYAKPEKTLISGETCHRLIGKDFNDFVAKLSDMAIFNTEKFDKDFVQDLSNVWLGRLDDKSKKNCTAVTDVISVPYKPLAEKYSGTTTCQGWTNESQFVQGYPVAFGQSKPPFPTCYTPEGKLTDSVGSAGLATWLMGEGSSAKFSPYQGTYCSNKKKLLCIEQ